MATKKNNSVVILGKKYSGKSYLANKIGHGLFNAGRRVLIVDPTNSFDLPVSVLRDADPGRFAQLGGRSAVMRPDADAGGYAMISFAWEAASLGAPLWLIVDEVDLYFGPHQYSEELMRIVRYGRHRGISLMAVCQRPASLNKNLLAQADRRVFFNISEPNDLDYCYKLTGCDRDRVRSLDPRQFIVF